MKIACPSCSRQYTIDDQKIGPKGLLVKCSVCSAEFRAQRSASPAGSPPPASVVPTAGEESLDDIFNDILDKPAAEPKEPAAEPKEQFDLDALHDKYSSLLPGEEDPAAMAIEKREERPVKRTAGAVIPSVDEPPAADPFIERNEDYVASVPPHSSQSTATGGGEQKTAAPAGKDLLDSLFDDMGGDTASDDEKTQNFNTLDLPLPSEEKKAAAAPRDRIEKKGAEKLARAPEGLSAEKKDALGDLFSDFSSDNIEQRLLDKSSFGDAADTGDLPVGAAAEPPTEKKIYIRRRQTNETIGPFPEAELAGMFLRKEINKNDFISYDGVRWEPLRDSGGAVAGGQTITASLKTDEPGLMNFDADGKKAKLSLVESVAARQATSGGEPVHLFNDSIATFDDETMQRRDIEHTVIPDTGGPSLLDGTSPGTEDARSSKKKKRKKRGLIALLLKLLLVLVVVSAAAVSAAWWYKNRRPKADILERISETITESAGTLSDVRESLEQDTRQGYLKSLGILKQYLRAENPSLAAVSLDAQVKANLLFSYDKKTEPFESVAERVEAMHRQHPQDPELAKALAFVLTAQQDYARAADLIGSIPDKNDPELFFLLGLIAKARKDLQNAESLFSSGYIASQTKSNKLAFAIAELKMLQGDVDGAVAFLNRIISASPYYIKAYLKKAEALAYEKKNIGDAITFLASIDANVLSQADETEKAVYYALLGDMHYRNGSTAEAIESYLRVVALDKENIKHLTDLAKIYQETKQSSAAMEYYEKALAVDNRYVPAIIGKAEVFIRLKKYNDAFLEIAKIDITNLSDANQLLRLANLFHQQNEREKAMQLYERAITADPSLVDAYLGRVFIYLEMNMYDEIRKLLDNIGELNRESHSYYLIQGILNHRDGNYKKAEESFRKALELNRSEDPRVFLFYGRFLYDRESFAQASEYFAKAVKASPEDPEYRVAFARSLEKEKKYRDILPLLESVEGNQRVHAQAFQLRAEALMQTGDLDNALKLIDRAISIDAKNAYYFYKKANILFHREEMNPAISVIETALLLDINSFESYVLFSKILLKKGDFKTAVEKLEEAARIDATSQQVYLLKGILLKNLDNYPEALRNFRKIRNNPELEKEALLEIAECYLNLEKTDEALKYFSKALKAGNKTALRFLARIYYDKNKLDQAAEYYRQSLKVFPDDHEPLKQLGYIFKERGRHTTARSYFKRYIKFLRSGDPERAMIEDEIYYSEKNIGTKKLSKIKKEEAEEESVGDDAFDDEGEGKTEEAKKLYMEAVSLAEADKKEAKRILRKVMKTVPAKDKYHIKARKLLKKIQEDEEEY